MATDDQQRLVTGQGPAPQDFKIPGNGQMRPKTINVVFDGTAAAAAFAPTLEIISDAGVVIARVPANQVAAGATAEVTWAPFLRQQGSGPVPVGPGAIIYDFTVTAASKAKIDTLTDGSYAGLLPQGFNVLEIWGMIRTDQPAIISGCAMFFNNDSTVGNYNIEYVYGQNVTPFAGNNNAPPGFDVHGNAGDANYAGIFQVTIPGYSQTTFNKMGLGGEGRVDSAAANSQSLWQLIGWRNTAAINQIVLAPVAPATALLQGSRMMIMAR